jgi:hypothetical protein
MPHIKSGIAEAVGRPADPSPLAPGVPTMKERGAEPVLESSAESPRR